MQLKISNYRGISTADITINSIALVAGPNEAGKTSTAQALAAVLTGDPVPIVGVKKNQAGVLVRSGTASGMAELTGPKGSTKVTWPTGKVSSEGIAPFASIYAAGMQSIVTMKDDDRVKVLTEYLKAAPTRADLDVNMKDLELTSVALEAIWDRIQKLGWDGTLKHYETPGATFKGQWMEVTGEQYGSKKAESWLPPEWEYGLDTGSEENLSALVTDARDSLEAAIKTDAVDDSKRADLQVLADLLPERQKAVDAAKLLKVEPALYAQLDEANGFIKSISDKRDVMLSEMKTLPQATQTSGMPCPHCSTVLQVAGDHLETAIVLTEDVLAARQTAIDELASKLVSVNDAIGKHMTSVASMQSRIKEIEKANEQTVADALRLMQESATAVKEIEKPVTAPSAVSIDDCRNTLATAENKLKAFKAKTRADRIHESVCTMEALIVKIAPDGIRWDVLVKSLNKFNNGMAIYTTAANWKPVVLESDLMPTYGGTPYLLLSESAKFRVRVVLQLAMAKLDHSDVVIIDAADILDKGGRSGLIKAVHASGLAAMVCMTMDDVAQMPNLKNAGIGASYWIGDGGVVG